MAELWPGKLFRYRLTQGFRPTGLTRWVFSALASFSKEGSYLITYQRYCRLIVLDVPQGPEGKAGLDGASGLPGMKGEKVRGEGEGCCIGNHQAHRASVL